MLDGENIITIAIQGHLRCCSWDHVDLIMMGIGPYFFLNIRLVFARVTARSSWQVSSFMNLRYGEFTS